MNNDILRDWIVDPKGTGFFLESWIHGYQFRHQMEEIDSGNGTLLSIGPFDTAPITNKVTITFDIPLTLNWLDEHQYLVNSRAETRFAYLILIHNRAQHGLEFSRSTIVLDDNPVNQLIDKIDDLLPVRILIPNH
ncbi:MAG: hypothetical protein P1V97_34715 [Planctomycetota bacterium]|nr:hypothetical protein [Planctomycetota bacterium]